MTFQIVDMAERHLPDAVEIWVTGWTQGHADVVPAALVALRTPGSFAVRFGALVGKTRVAVSGGAVVGFCIVERDEIYQMYVREAAQGTGVAQALIGDAEARIFGAGFDVAWLACAVGNARAARFYEKSGWVNKGVETVALETLGAPFDLDVWRFETRAG